MTATDRGRCSRSTICDTVFRAEGEVARAVDGVSFTVSPRRDLGDRRGVRQRQVGDLAVDHAPGADPAGGDRRRHACLFRGRDLLRLSERADAHGSAATRSA